MKIRSKCVGEVVAGRSRAASPRPAYMSMATTTLVRAAMTHAVTNM